MSDLPPVVGKRNHFGCLQLSVEMGVAEVEYYFPGIKNDRRFSEWLLRYSSQILEEFRNAVEVGSAAGIAQSIALFRDPSYYEHKRIRRQTATQNRAERRAKEREAQREKEWTSPDPLEVRRIRLRQEASMYRQMAECRESELSRMEAPKNLVIPETRKTQ